MLKKKLLLLLRKANAKSPQLQCSYINNYVVINVYKLFIFCIGDKVTRH